MKRASVIALAFAIVIVCLMAGPENEAAASRRGQEPIAGYGAMYCSTMHNITFNAKDTVNAPEGWRIARFDIWTRDVIAMVMDLKFFRDVTTEKLTLGGITYLVGNDSTEVVLTVFADTTSTDQWSFPYSCDRIILWNETTNADWTACAYLMYYGEGAGVVGMVHPWKRGDAAQ